MRHRVILWALLFAAAQNPMFAAKEEKWFQISSDHFLLFSDAGEVKGRKLLADFEGRVATFSQAFGAIPPRQFPIEVLLFDKDEDFYQALPRPQGEERQNKSAYLIRGPDRLFIVARDKSPEDIANDVAHALGHVLFERYAQWQPFWLSEGAAEYVRKVGRAPETKVISDEEGYTASELVGIVQSSTYNDADPRSAFRTKSYRLIRILLEEKPETLKQYLQTLRHEAESLPKFPIDMTAFDARLKEYAETPLKMAAMTPDIKSVEVDRTKVSIHIGDVVLATDRATDAARWYNADTKEARAARAIVTRFTRSPAEAIRVLDRAAREAPDNGLVQYHLGTIEIPEKLDRKDLQSQIAALERAVQLLPLMGRAQSELARVYTLNGQPEKATPLISRALDLEPEFADRAYEIRADIRVAMGQYDQAFRDIKIAEAAPHTDKSMKERFTVKVMTFRKKIETARREAEDRRVQRLRSEVGKEVAEREPPPKPAPPPPPVPEGRISYEIEARAPIEVVEAIYPEYPVALRKSGAAGAIALRVDVGPAGKVKNAVVATSQLPDLNAATVDAVKKWSFKPGNRSIRLIVTYSLR